MTFITPKLLGYLPMGGAICFLALSCSAPSVTPPDGPEPIAYIGHGGFFDQQGKQMVPTADFVARAQDWYRRKMLSGLDKKKQAEFAAFEKRLNEGVEAKGQARLLLQQRALDWLAANSPKTRDDKRTLGKLSALAYELNWKLPTRQDLAPVQQAETFQPDPALAKKLGDPEFNPEDVTVLAFTLNSGRAYVEECRAAGVPIPPPIGQLDPAGTAGWKSEGFIPRAEQFIEGTPAEVRTFQSPDGLCIALPRYVDSMQTSVKLDGVVCLGRTTSNVCFWDNQMRRTTFQFAAGDRIPIGFADPAVDPMNRYQAGGLELEMGGGGVCTDCHAGENPFIIHPKSVLRPGFTMEDLQRSLPTFSPNRYVPIVAASWPQNRWSQARAFAPAACNTCHVKRGAGRFPHLSSELNNLPGYCRTVLTQAIARTMPPGPPPLPLPGSQAGTPPVNDFLRWCTMAAMDSTADMGDPHLTTGNGDNYDFQAAGEFTALLNSDTGFELQTRQTPVLTSFAPGANRHTGLASCVSLNTAAAVRVGSHRISYQPSAGGPARPEEMQLRIDGRLVTLPPRGIDLGGGDRIARAAAGGGLDVRLADGTRLLITPHFWASEGYWYLDVQALNTRAREGIMGHILPSNWLPLAPDGSSFGPAPGTLAARHALLNRRFADAWRVKPATSLFDYAPGTSTATFTDRLWPPPSGAACTRASGTAWGPGRTRRPVQGMKLDDAKRLCRPIRDPTAYRNCVYDMNLMGDRGVVEAYLRSLEARRAAMR